MSSIGTGYDLDTTTLSPDGRVFQVEYAQKAVDNGGTVVGLQCKDGVVLGVEKLVQSKMLVEGSGRRIVAVDRHAGMACGGLVPDGRQVVNRTRAEASNYKSFYGDLIPGKVLCDRVASYKHLFSLYWSVRPFGVCSLLGCYDKDGPALFMLEPSGVSYKYFGTAVGKGRQTAKTEIEKLNLKEMTCREGVVEVAKIIYGVHDDVKDKNFELELGWVCDESDKLFKRVPEDVLAEAVRVAKAAKEEDEMDD
mmetsp:Transcript_1505/g.5155  ORF Transcript_1505/g.5155 Transcript_1505/m.5155 type:complete len:251 (+) Transcript_1505:196-948(+)